jgi:hypothetical protein
MFQDRSNYIMGFFPTDHTTNWRHSPHHKNKRILSLSLSHLYQKFRCSMKEGQEQILINIIRSDSWQLIEYNQTQENDILLLLDMSCFEFWSLHSLSPPSLFPLCITISGRRLDCNLLLLTCRKNKTKQKQKKLNKSTSYCLGVDRRVTCVHTQGLILFSFLLGF